MIICPTCGSRRTTQISDNEYQCLSCGETFTEFEGLGAWEEEEEEMDGGLGEDLFGEDW